MVAPIVAAAGIGAASSLLSGIMGGNAAKSAARTQRAAAKDQIKFAKKQFARQDELQGEMFSGQVGDIRRGRDTQVGVAAGERNALAGLYGNLREQGGADAARTYAGISGRNAAGLDYATGQITDARDQSIAGFQPAANMGNNALAAYGYNLGLGGGKPSGYTGLGFSAGDKFLLGEGLNTTQETAAMQGALDSGATAEALERVRSGLAAQSRERQQAELFALGGLGQSATANIANLRTGAAGDLVAARGGYDNAQNMADEALRSTRYGIGADYTNGMANAQRGFADRATGASQGYVANMGNARVNRANLSATNSANFSTNALNGMANRGDAGAAGAIGVGNAWANAIDTGFGVAGYLGQNPNALSGFGNMFKGMTDSYGMPRFPGMWKANAPMARPG
jgi:hypothetical protein